MDVKILPVGPYATNCYIVSEGAEVMVVDPGSEPDRILEALGSKKPKYLLITHAHWDHVGALPALVEAAGAPVLAHAEDAPFVYGLPIGIAAAAPQDQAAHREAVERGMAVDTSLHDGDELTLGGKALRVLHTPGHTPGCLCLYAPEDKRLFAGDTLFANGRYGRTDFPRGDNAVMVNTLKTKFVDIPDDVTVYSGHEGYSTMGRERQFNPYLR